MTQAGSLMDKRLSILVIAAPERAAPIVEGLRASGDPQIRISAIGHSLAHCVAAHRPDIVLIHLARPSRGVLEELAMALGATERAVAMFVDRSDAHVTRAAIAAGISAYVVDGLRPERIGPVLDAALARFQILRRLRDDLAAARNALDEHKVIDRAKAVLMKARGIDENAAHALLRKTAMDRGKRLAEIARQVVLTAGLLSSR